MATLCDPEQGDLAAVGVKVALSDFSLAVGRGTCLGLLGENGAGKTTAISMLSGMFPASAGDAFVGGYHIGNETDAVRSRIGICPQLDTLWPTLTGESRRRTVQLGVRALLPTPRPLAAPLARCSARTH